MNRPTPLLTACQPRPIHQTGDQYAADLIRGLDEELATAESAADFLETTYLTKPAHDFLRMAMDRITRGRDSAAPSVYQLYSRYGGGKTHSLLLLAAAAKYPGLGYWQDAAALPTAPAKVIAFDGEKHNVDGAAMDNQGARARSLAGYILHRLGGPAALDAFREGDQILSDPGSDAFRALIGDDPVIIVIDELVHYLSRVNQRVAANPNLSADGVLTTLSALSNAVANSPRAVLVITTPEDSHELLDDAASPTAANPTAGDAHHANALALTNMLNRINSQLGRVMHPVAPSGESDLPAILRKRLFREIDETARQETARAYADLAARNGRSSAILDQERFYNDYPFHPWLLEIITTRLAANRNFQRVRGTLRLLANTLREMQNANDDAALIHPRHVTPRHQDIRSELVNRPGFYALDPAIETDIIGRSSTADKTGNPLAEPAAVTMLLGSIAPENVNGLYSDQLADALLSPADNDLGLIADAIDQFLSRAIYVDDRPETQRRRFTKDANVMKELLEARDALLTNTEQLSQLLRQGISSVYHGGRRADQFELTLFPSRHANVPDRPDRAGLGIVNPEHWNWTDAGNTANGMNNQDLLDLHRHSSNNDGNAPRLFPNNALLLAAHDANLSRIREDLATMEAADRLLKDPSRPLSGHRRETLESIRAASEKNATVGIQNKFIHLFSAGNSPQHQWPEPNSHLEHRALESITDAAGKGQDGILQALGDRALRGAAAGLNRSAWARIHSIAGETGSALGELRQYFARTLDTRIVINETAWQAMISNGIRSEALHVITPDGEVNPAGYQDNWQVWLKGHEPKPAAADDKTDAAPAAPTAPPAAAPGATPGARQTAYTTGKLPGNAACEAVKRFIADHGHDWPNLESCQIQGASPSLADQIASIAQGDDHGIAITMMAQSPDQRLQIAIRNAPPSEYKDYAAPARRMLTKAGITDADVTIRLEPAAAQRILEKLNPRDDANITVTFR